ncbi:MAG: hypothetical protein IT510_08790 [Sulfuritalea sp.]|nr:hypothetical protein [Sulfuritalea sp.]
MKHVLMFAANDGNGNGGGGGSGDDDFENPAELRDCALRLGNILVWHAKNTPLSVWKKGSKADLSWPSKLLHTLYNNRPKRPATAQDMVKLARLLRRMRGYDPAPELLAEFCDDPDWHIFELANNIGDDDGEI